MSADSLEELEKLVTNLIDGRLSEAEAERLDSLLSQSPDAIQRYHELMDNHEALCAIYPGDVFEASLDSAELPHDDLRTAAPQNRTAMDRWPRWAVAATFLITVGLAGYFLGHGRAVSISERTSERGDQIEESDEQTIAGHATLRRAVDIDWPENATAWRQGDVLPDGILRFDDGIAEIDFFCGATLIVEGPAIMDVESDWSVRVIEGRLRANVPPAARGFTVKAAESEIVDLGTEFALEVGSDNARVEVIDGEVELRGGEHDGKNLVTGQRQWLKGTAHPEAFKGLSTVVDVQRRREDAEKERFRQWKDYSRLVRSDARLIAYYPIAESQEGRVVPNLAPSGESLNGQLIGPVVRTTGRFGALSGGLEFDRPGSRVRQRIDGEFEAFTFSCWTKIDSLEHRYNALFMVDGYETGEPHWQIRDDGRLMFSVMVDDTHNVPRFDKTEQRIIKTAGRHHIYYTNPFWDLSKSGQWFHIVAVYDPLARRVAQYVNGELLGNEEITAEFHVPMLRIGPAEIGNWGQPSRNTPWFAVRNLNGTIDELAIFNAALSPEEIRTLYEQGKTT